MSRFDLTSQELWSIFDARRVKAPDLKGPDLVVSAIRGYIKNRQPMLKKLREQANRVSTLEESVHNLCATHFREAVDEVRQLARVGKMVDAALDKAVALSREA